MKSNLYDVIIIGSGPAGYSAAIYSKRGNLKTLLITGSSLGGQLCLTDNVENYPGFSKKYLNIKSKSFEGQILMDIMHEQTEELEVDIIYKNVIKVDFEKQYKVFTNNEKYIGKSIIIATGATAKKMNVKGFNKFFNKGVSMCATCDGMLFKNKNVIVVGGGNTAVEEALFLSKICNKVFIIHRRDSLRAEKILQNRLFKKNNIEVIWNTELYEIKGSTFENNINNKVTSVDLINNNDNNIFNKSVDAVFIAIGHNPNTKIFQNYINCDDNGYINSKNEVDTNLEGIFCAGDVSDREYKQAITAASSGCKAALKAIKFVQ